MLWPRFLQTFCSTSLHKTVPYSLKRNTLSYLHITQLNNLAIVLVHLVHLGLKDHIHNTLHEVLHCNHFSTIDYTGQHTGKFAVAHRYLYAVICRLCSYKHSNHNQLEKNWYKHFNISFKSPKSSFNKKHNKWQACFTMLDLLLNLFTS